MPINDSAIESLNKCCCVIPASVPPVSCVTQAPRRQRNDSVNSTRADRDENAGITAIIHGATPFTTTAYD